MSIQSEFQIISGNELEPYSCYLYESLVYFNNNRKTSKIVSYFCKSVKSNNLNKINI